MRSIRRSIHLFTLFPLLVILITVKPTYSQVQDVVQAISLESAEFLVGLEPGGAELLRAALPAGAAITGHLDPINVIVVRAPQPAAPYSLSLPATAVRWIEPNGTVSAAEEVVPDDSYYPDQQWALPKIGLPSAWSFSRGGAAPLAVIDSGIDQNHDDLASRIWRNPGEIAGNSIDDDGNGYIDDVAGWDFVDADPDPDDLYYHGTHVAGIAGAATNNGLGIAGVTWETPLMAVRVLNAAGEGRWDHVAAGIIYAANNGARVLNLSLGGGVASNTIINAIAYAYSQGCLVVAAAGNNGGSVLFPARLAPVLSVGATNEGDEVWVDSNRGAGLDLVAPGVQILSTTPGSQYRRVTGTSMATPHVSGVAALVWDRAPALTAGELTDLLLRTAVDLPPAGRDDVSGWGRVDAAQAVSAVLPYHTFFPVFVP